MIDMAVSVGRLGPCCGRLPVPPRMMAENGKVQKTVGLVLKSLRKSRSQEIIAETGKVRYHCVPKKESWTFNTFRRCMGRKEFDSLLLNPFQRA